MTTWVQDNNTVIWHISTCNYQYTSNTLCGLERISTSILICGSPLLEYPEANLCSICKTLELLRKLSETV